MTPNPSTLPNHKFAAPILHTGAAMTLRARARHGYFTVPRVRSSMVWDMVDALSGIAVHCQVVRPDMIPKKRGINSRA